ncbi:MAG: hypothetical protein A3G34_14520 [Candidatus Lindowbacteria bacterium RIFCSPLOWO2_12_FULL_62_27]|nr:MAG: hypothetical protein A3I06_15930 [Candidatus Lindowbacteria bacterium RIFCSPLOWO2_02_FULL_62_12]OGH63077.1 MAG: hypothetical protein A3G34_14520 [Candidatus Lindowbacteria bacterium RIFCSPLOWO2_12_FULL_62_27]
MNIVTLARGHKLFFEGDPARDIFFLTAGKLTVMKGNTFICELEPPAFIGELGCILSLPRTTTVYACIPTTLEARAGRELLERMTLKDDHGWKFLQALSRRFDLTKARVLEYQFTILDECRKILSVLIADQQVADKRLKPADVKKLRPEAERLLAESVRKEDPVFDFDVLKSTARRYRVDGKFESVLSAQFRSFTPLDLKPFRIPNFDTYLNFESAARDIAEKVVVLTRYMADFVTLELPTFESDAIRAEKKVPFGRRGELLKKLFVDARPPAPDESSVQLRADFESALQAFSADPTHETRSLFPLARCFDLDQAYLKNLPAVLKER